MHLHLFSSPGTPPIRNVVRTCRELLRDHPDPLVAYLPAASYGDNWAEFTRRAFSRVAPVLTIDAEVQSRSEIEAALDRASALYIPGGNTFLLVHRLHKAGVLDSIRERVRGGLPLVAFSAGAVLCGPNILTTNDPDDLVPTPITQGLELLPFNLNVHYPESEGPERAARDAAMSTYHATRDNPILALEDSAYVRVASGQVELAQGAAWLYRKGEPRTPVAPGTICPYTED